MDKVLNFFSKLNLSEERANTIIAFVKRSINPVKKIFQVNVKGEAKSFVVKRQGLGPIVNDHGKFYVYAFIVDDEWEKYIALVKASSLSNEDLPVFVDNDNLLLRIDSGCETGQRFHDNTCECNQQLEEAMKMLNKKGEGIIVCIPNQDGRGKGIAAKLTTLALQDGFGLDTVTAAEIVAQIEKPITISIDDTTSTIDIRTYAGAIAILKFFNIPEGTRINLATNNPEKITAFNDNGYIIDNVSVIITPTEHTKKHLLAKQDRLGHKLFL
ncbi:MAG: hypothetical protein ABI367_11385 [Mucilaginibacter sp.]